LRASIEESEKSFITPDRKRRKSVNPISTSPRVTEVARSGSSSQVLKTLRFMAAVIWTLTIMTLCWLPKKVVHQVEGRSSWFEIHHLDKAIHCGIFVIFSVLWCGLWTSWRRFARVGFMGLGLAALSEIGQLVPFVGRDASVADGASDMLGCLIGLALVPLVEPLLRSIETHLFGASNV
jgi:VanZ family protein